MKKSIKKKAAEEEVSATEVEVGAEGAAVKKKKHTMLRASIMLLLVFTFICGFVYTLSVTLVGQVAFPYEANGSQIIVTLPNGDQKIYGSEDIGQNYEDPIHLFGRVNLGSPSNLSPESDEYLELLEKRVQERKDKLAAVGYTEEADIPLELISASAAALTRTSRPTRLISRFPRS